MKKFTRDDTEHGKEYYLASDVDALMAQPAQQNVDRFCDSNCTWSDHHPDCKLTQPAPAQEPSPIPLITDEEWAALNEISKA